MSAEITLRDLLEVQAYYGLPSPALVEKDFHVVKVLAAIVAVNTAPLGLVFGGGTALCRAHRQTRTPILLSQRARQGGKNKYRELVAQDSVATCFERIPRGQTNGGGTDHSHIANALSNAVDARFPTS